MPLSTSGASRSPGVATAESSSDDLWKWVDLERAPRVSTMKRGSGQNSEQPGPGEEEAYRRGLEEGADSARASARAEFQDALRATLEACEEVRVSRETWAAALTENLAVLAAGMAARIIGQAHVEDPTLFVELAGKAVAAFPVEESLRIRLHPRDRAILDDEEALMRVVGTRGIHWIRDEAVVRGGCIVEGPHRIVDGRVDEALRRVVEALSDA